MEAVIAMLIAIAIMTSINAKALGNGIISAIAVAVGWSYYAPDTNYLYLILGGYIIGYLISGFRS